MLMTRFWEVVVSIDIHEKRHIWMSRDSAKPAPVFAMDSTRDIERVCLIAIATISCIPVIAMITRILVTRIQAGVVGVCLIMPAAILAASGCDRVELFRDHAVVLMIESLESSMASDHDLNLFLCAWASHSRGKRWHSHRVSPVFLFSNHASQRRLQKGCA